MEYTLLPKIDTQLKNYQKEHRGDLPLYIIISSEEGGRLREEVRRKEGHSDDVTVTTFRGVKIMANDLIEPGEIRLGNDLPETSS